MSGRCYLSKECQFRQKCAKKCNLDYKTLFVVFIEQTQKPNTVHKDLEWVVKERGEMSIQTRMTCFQHNWYKFSLI